MGGLARALTARRMPLLAGALLVGGCTQIEGGIKTFPDSSACTAQPELCDGLDNDCDGEADELAGLLESGAIGVACGTNEGVCERGVATCVEGVPVCDGEVGPTDELCDGVDTDCDGDVDERADLAAAGIAGIPCGGDVGACAPGIQECEDAALVCVGGVRPAEGETCDGVDEDCDGTVDEAAAGVCEACAPEGAQGVCAQGVSLCSEGALVCAPHLPADWAPVEGECDGLDSDCDGVVDELGEGAPPADELRAQALQTCGPAEAVPEPGPVCPADGGATTRWSCTPGEAGASCLAQQCAEGFRLAEGRCEPIVEICNNGVDDDADGLVDGSVVDDPCAATVDVRGQQLTFGDCRDRELPGCEDTERLGGAFLNECVGDDCPFRVELTYAYGLDREEVSQRAYLRCVEDGCCDPPSGRIWSYVRDIADAAAQRGEPLPRRPRAPARCMGPPIILPEGQDPAGEDAPDDAVRPNDPILLDLPVAGVSWCQARTYCAWAGKRLPTQYEWERAVVGQGVRRRYGWGESEPTECPELDCCRAPDFEHEGAPPPGCDPQRPEIPICETDVPEQTRRRCLATYGGGPQCKDAELDRTCPGCVRATSPVWSNEDGATPLGLLNMNGNLLEWTYDWAQDGGDWRGPNPRTDPVGSACHDDSGRWRPQRGGSFLAPKWQLNSVLGLRNLQVVRAPFLGFRCARTLPEEAGVCDPGVPDVVDRCGRLAEPAAACAAPDFVSVRESDLPWCADGQPDRTPACRNPLLDLCRLEEGPGCDPYLMKRLLVKPDALYSFVPRALIGAVGINDQALVDSGFDQYVDQTSLTALAPSGGRSLLAIEVDERVGQVDGEFPGRIGAADIDDDGVMRYLTEFADPDAGEGECAPSHSGALTVRSERNSLEIQSLCNWSRWLFAVPSAARKFVMSGLFVQAEFTAQGIEGDALALVNEQDAVLWTRDSPPQPDPLLEESRDALNVISFCELFDVAGCAEKPPSCPEGHLASCPEGDTTCNGFVVPFRFSAVRASESGVPGLRACEAPE